MSPLRSHLAFAFLIATLVAPAAGAEPFGDVDGDCDVDVADAVLLERALAGIVTLTDEQELNANLIPIGGSEKDDTIDVGDLTTLKQLVAGDGPVPTPVAAPVIDSVTGTNPVTVSGSGAPADWTILLYVNGERYIPTVVANASGEFTFFGKRRDPWDDPETAPDVGARQVPLNDGENRITVIATSGGVRSCSSAPWVVDYDPPTLANPPDPIPSHSLVVWTAGAFGGQPVVIDEDFRVEDESVLIIQPGVELRFAAGVELIAAYGTNIQIHGSPDAKVLLGPAGGVGGPCDGTTRWGGLRLLAHHGSEPGHLIEHAHIDCVTTGVSAGQGSYFARLDVRDTEISRWAYNGISAGGTGMKATIVDNRLVDGPGNAGIVASGTTAINRNVVRGNNSVVSTNGAVLTSFKQNDIRGGKVAGVRLSGSTEAEIDIEENTITDNCNGVVLEQVNTSVDPPTLIHNNIYDNENCTGGCGPYAATSCSNYTTYEGQGCQLPPPANLPDLPATDNWWGTTDAAVIESKLHGWCAPSEPIEFIPYLDAPFDEGGVSVGGENVIQGDVYDGMPGFPSGSVWLVLGSATVPAGETFTIPDGTTLEFSANSDLIVEGLLVVEDTVAADVLFTSYVVAGETAAPGDWDGLLIRNGGQAVIADAVIEYAGPAIVVTGTDATGTVKSHLELSGSLVRKFLNDGVRVEDDAEADIHDNRDAGGTLGIFAGSGTHGIRVEDVDPSSSVRIENNEIRGASAAVRAVNASPGIHGNLLWASGFGVYVGDGASPVISSDPGAIPAVPGNEITGNCWGIYVDAPSTQPQPVVTENEIHANDGCPGNGSGNYNYYVDSYGSGSVLTLDAEYNWWGGSPSTALSVAASIRDHTEGAALPSVDFLPFYREAGPSDLDGGTYLLGPMSSDPGDPDDDLDAGTYPVVGSLFVAPGAIWRIGENAVLEFPQNYGLRVEGELVIQGSAGSEAVLRKSGAVSWSGIDVVGAGASIDIQHADISGSSILVDVEDATQPVSIRDSVFSGFTNTAIALEDVHPASGAVLERNVIDNSGALGTGVKAVDSTLSLVDDNQIRNLAVGVLVAGSSSVPTIGSTATNENQITDFAQVGVLFTGVPGGSIANNLIENDDVMPRKGTGILLDTSSPQVHQNTVRFTDLGIHVIGASSPLIGEVAPATPPSNVIESNRIGIRLEGTPSGTEADQPDPTITRNHLAGNDEAPLEVVDYSPDTGFDIDARENWWGAGTAAGIRALIALDPSNPRPVDFSGYYLDASMSSQSTDTDQFSTVIRRVTRSAPTFTPTITPDDSVDVTVELAGAAVADVTLEIYEEDDDARANLIYQETQPAVVGSHAFTWDGRYNQGAQSGEWVDDEAYVYVVSAAGSLGTYDPPRVQTQAAAQRVGSSSQPYNVFRNDFMKIVFDMNNDPGRSSLKMLTDTYQNGGTLIRTLFEDVAFPERDFLHFVYDGRDETQGHVLESHAQTSRFFYVSVPKDLHPNHVIVERVRPQIRPPDYDPTVPRIEVLSDPYLVINSYDQVTTIVFQLDQPADVSLQIHDEQMAPVGPPLAPTLLASPPAEPLTYTLTWSGVDVLTGGAYDLVDGSYTFAITASNPTQPALSTTWRGVIQVRQ